MKNNINSGNIESFIKDYKSHESDIKKWFELKGKYNYCEYAKILYTHKIEINWEILTHIYRYDKRLHFVLYKYISLIEEFFRSLLFELFKSENKKIMKLSFSKIIECIEKNICSINSDNLNKNILLENKKIFIEIRNSVAHSKILLGNKFDNMDLNYTLSRFKELLPDSYEKGFKTSISKYSENLELMPKILLISLDG